MSPKLNIWGIGSCRKYLYTVVNIEPNIIIMTTTLPLFLPVLPLVKLRGLSSKAGPGSLATGQSSYTDVARVGATLLIPAAFPTMNSGQAEWNQGRRKKMEKEKLAQSSCQFARIQMMTDKPLQVQGL